MLYTTANNEFAINTAVVFYGPENLGETKTVLEYYFILESLEGSFSQEYIAGNISE